MSSESTTAKVVKDLTGMWWPAADADKLRSAADAWTAMATALDSVTGTANSAAQSVIGSNHGPAIDAFRLFWERYYKSGTGWLPDSAAACRQMATALNDFAAQVDKAVHQLEEEAVIVGATLVAGAALAFFTAGLSEAAAGAATAAIVSAAEAIGVTVSETVASIAATTLTGVAFGTVESATVDIAVAQPVRIAFGDGGFSGTELLSAAETGGLAGGLTSGLGAGARALSTSADGAAGASTALAGIGRIADGLGTLPGRMATGAALGAGQDALLNNGNITGLDVLAGAIGGASSPGSGRRGIGDDPRTTAVPAEGRTCVSDPVDIASGEMVLPCVDVELPGALPLILRRTHISSYRAGRWFGPSWASTLDQRVEVDAEGIVYVAPDGMLLAYPAPEPDVPVMPIEGPRWPLTWDGTSTTVSIHQPESGHTLCFAPADPEHPDGVLPLASLGDRNGHRISYHYSPAGAPVLVEHSGGYRIAVDTAAGRIIGLRLLPVLDEGPIASDTDAARVATVALTQYGYDGGGNLTDVFNSSREPLQFTYDTAGRVTRWQDRNGTRYRYHYDSRGRCTSTHGSDDFLKATFTYDELNRVTETADSLGFATAYHLNAAHQVVRVTDPLGAVTTSEWDRYDRLLSRTDPLGRTTAFGYDTEGNLDSVTYPDGNRSSAVFNALHQPVTVTDPAGARWDYTYDHHGNRTSVTDPARATTRYGYDQRGLLTTVTDALGQSSHLENNPAGLPTAFTDPSGGTTRIVRDAFGNIAASTDPAGGTTRCEWTTEGKLRRRTLPDGTTESWQYDGEGNLVEHRDPADGTTRFEFTHFDLPSVRTDPDGTRYSFAYDTELRLVSVTDARNLTWAYEYDGAGRVLRETDFDGRVLAYRYDVTGQLVERTNGAGQTIRYVHNERGNVIEQRDADNLTTYAYDPAGRMVSAANPQAEIAWAHDPVGRVLTETCNGLSLAHEYDLAGNRVLRRTPSGAISRWAFDASRRPVTLHTAGRTLAFAYDTAGRETERHLGNDLILHQAWDPNDRLVEDSVVGLEPSAAELRRRYDYGAAGHLAGIEDERGRHRAFTHDPAGRITSVTGDRGREAYSYDRDGQLTHADWPGAAGSEDSLLQGQRQYTGSRLHRVGRAHYEYDQQGRIVQRTVRLLSGSRRIWRFTWDAEDRLTQALTPDGSRWHYLYDPLGRRVAKRLLDSDGGIKEEFRYSWDGTTLAEQRHVVADADGEHRAVAHVTTWEYAPGSQRPLTQNEHVLHERCGDQQAMSQDEIDTRFFAIVTDLVGAPTELLDADGRTAWALRTNVWGVPAETPSDGAVADCPLRFPGQYYDSETGLHYNVQRYYDPLTGRYATPDPLGLDPAPDHYAYVANPLQWADPLGLAPCIILYHYTNEDGLTGILNSQELRLSTGSVHARYGDGQYFTDIAPQSIKGLKKADLSQQDVQQGNLSHYQLVGRLYGRPTAWGLGRSTHFVAVDVTGLDIITGRPNVQLHPNTGPLDLTGRIRGSGKVTF
jgi:RHS repeat-associated protein